MGSSSSTTQTEKWGNQGNTGLYFGEGGSLGGPFIVSGTGNISFSTEPGKGNTVANATGKTLRIFYHKEEIELEDLLEKDSKTNKRVFKPQANMSFIQLQPKQQLVAPSVEEGFASVLVADPGDTEVYVETISLNFPVPYGACCIVAAKNEIKYRKCDAGVWIDEDGHDHCT